MSPKTDAPAITPDVDLEEVKTHELSGPRIRCPLCGWSPPKEHKWLLHLRQHMEYFRYGRSVSSLSLPMD